MKSGKFGVAATIMSKMGYREGSGLGAKEQGISRALQVQRTGRNVGLIVGEEKAAVITSLSEEENEEEERRGGSISYILGNNGIFKFIFSWIF
uniref:G-patch domain-containing protein n=1 Tax=Meloidogyne enterolobii TaxID=390850 RepID=A0A6V7UKH0_MELEN|nr:unnamed protein product [Meloidogyne enterolobii]